MNGVVGHTGALAILEKALPPVTLLLGPPSIGKWTIAHRLADHYDIAQADRFLVPDGLGVDIARSLITFCRRAPFGTHRYVAARLTGSSSNALNAMLKILEEPPPTVRFVLTATGRPLPTIVSRATVIHLGALTPDELTRVLIAQGVTAPIAAKAAHSGGGVRPALAAVATSDRRRTAVVELMRAVAARDALAFDKTVKTFDDDARELLVLFLREAALGTPVIFTSEEMLGLHRNRPMAVRMLRSLLNSAGVTARLGVRAALEPYLALT